MSEFDIFLSYKQELKDSNRIEKLYDLLLLDHYKVWWEKKQLLKEDDYYDQLTEAIENSNTILCCISKNYISSPNCKGEMSYAFNLKKRIIPNYNAR